MDTVLIIDRSAQGATVKKSKNPRRGSGLTCLVHDINERREGQVLPWLSGLCKPDQRRHRKKTYLKSVMHATAATAWKRATELPEKVATMDEVVHKVCINSELLCAMPYINAAISLPANATPKVERCNKPREKDVQFF